MRAWQRSAIWMRWCWIWTIFSLVWVSLTLADTLGNEDQMNNYSAGLVKWMDEVVNQVWNSENLQTAASLRRSIREVSRQARDVSTFLSPIMAPLISTATTISQVVSFVPGLMNGAVTGISTLVDITGVAISTFAYGLEYGAVAVDSVGRSIQAASTTLPTVVAGVVVGGLGILLLYPGLYDWFISAAASAGLLLANRAAAGARTFVDEESVWSTVLQAMEVFTLRAREEYVWS